MWAQLDPSYRRAGIGPTWVRLLSWALFEGRPLTTRGRWINPLVLGLHAVHCRLPRLASVDRPIFIIGMGRSGTTLLGKILSLHPEVGFLNEPKALWHVAVGREDVVGSFDRGPARYRLGAADAGERETRRLRRTLGAYLRWTRRRRVVDKNPEVVYRTGFVRQVFPDSRLIFLVRSGWAVCRSVARWSRENRLLVRGETQDWWGADRRKWRLMVEELVPREPDLAPEKDRLSNLTDERQMAALEWILSGRYADRAGALRDDLLVVRYEDLVDRPVETTDSVCHHCELEPDQRVATYCRAAVRAGPAAEPFELLPALELPFRRALARWGYDDR